MLIAFLYNIRHQYPDPKDPATQLETDFDDQITIDWFIKHLKQIGYEVLPIEADENAYLKLKENKRKITLAYNYSLGLYGNSRYAQIPAMLEMLQIPYTGSPPLTQALLMNKAKMKDLFRGCSVPTPPGQIFKSINDILNSDLLFPLIVKPIAQGSSAGVTNKSVVNNEEELKTQVDFILKTFNEPALVETFLTGREFSVGMVGNPPQIMPIIEPNHASLPKDFHHIDSLEVKWILEEKIGADYFLCPAKVDDELKSKLENICLSAWNTLEINDYCRIDLRCDNKNNPYVIDVNSPPGMIPPEVSTTSYLPLAGRAAGMDYNQLLQKIISSALTRYQKKS